MRKLKIENQELKDEIEKLRKQLKQQNSDLDLSSQAETQSEASSETPNMKKKNSSSFFKLKKEEDSESAPKKRTNKPQEIETIRMGDLF